MYDYFEEKGIQKEETKHILPYSGQSAGMAGGLTIRQGGISP